MAHRCNEADDRGGERDRIDRFSGAPGPAEGDGQNRGEQQRANADEQGGERHRVYRSLARRLSACGALRDCAAALTADSLRRTPRPPRSLSASSAMRTTPAASSAAISFMSESTVPRMTPSLASIRWMVGAERPES